MVKINLFPHVRAYDVPVLEYIRYLKDDKFLSHADAPRSSPTFLSIKSLEFRVYLYFTFQKAIKPMRT